METWQIEVLDVEEVRLIWKGKKSAHVALRSYCRATGRVPLWWLNGAFGWICPNCGHEVYGRLSPDEIPHMVESTNHSRWVNLGDEKAPTFVPELWCPHCHDLRKYAAESGSLVLR